MTTPPAEVERAWIRFLRGRRHVLLALLLAGAVPLLGRDRFHAGERRAALAELLAKRGLEASAEDVLWVDRPGGPLGSKARAVVRAAPAKGEPNDVFLVETELSPEGVLLRAGDAYNLTETNSADESRPIVKGQRIAYVSRPTIEGVAPTVHVVDLGGQRPPSKDWTRFERVQNAITNYQQSGQLRGIAKRTFAVEDEPAKPGEEARAKPVDLTIDLDDAGALTVRAAGRSARIADKTPLPAWVRSEEVEIAKPGNLVTWSVDRVRAIPWIGDDAMQTIKAVAFTALDFVMRNKEQVTGDTGAESIAKDLGQTELEPTARTLPVDPEIGWPPPPLETWVTPTLPGEGEWHPLDKDVFVRRLEGLPPAFLTTFIRSDRSRKATRVYVALWDPRQVELHMMAGTIEPKGATGEAGAGVIPRTPEVLRRVIAASNAGFQAMHGEFGMMADGTVYLPPKQYGATVAVLRDGTTGFGTWPENQTVPESIVSYRQNMTVMVQDEKFNPYGRTWWGGTPPGWPDKTHTVRTGICLTKERFIAYFYGADISPDALSQAMIQTRCSYGLALDMNAGHAGLEFYKIAPEQEFEPFEKPLQHDWQAEGTVQRIDGWKFRARRLIRGMGLMNFPRYIKTEARDFFYMTLRHLLPGPNVPVRVKPGTAGEGEWRVKGLPQQGFPYALALTEFRPSAASPELKARVLKVDPRTVVAKSEKGDAKAKTVMVVDAGEAAAGAPSVWHSAGAFSLAPAAPAPGAARLVTGQPSSQGAVAAVGVDDDGGMLVYVELTAPSPNGGKVLEELLKSFGCSAKLFLAKPWSLALGGDSDLGQKAVRPPSGATAVELVRAEAPGAKRILEDTPVVPLKVWYPLQQHRVRYFKKPQGAEAGAEEK